MTRLEELTIALEALEHARQHAYFRVVALEYERQIKTINQKVKELLRETN